jgi:hypothetical protein
MPGRWTDGRQRTLDPRRLSPAAHSGMVEVVTELRAALLLLM